MTLNLPLPIENDALRLEVWPLIGGKVSSLVDKADRFDLLFNYPAELPVSSQYDQSYGNSWQAGWDECFPAVAPSTYTGHPYSGVRVPDHGELWGLPTQATPSKDGITCIWHGLRFGYRLTRTIRLEGPTLVAEYELENLAPFEFRFVWAQHALLSMTEPVELSLPPGLAMHATRELDDEAGQQRRLEWPVLPGEGDFSRLEDLPGHQGWKLYSCDVIDQEAAVRYPRRGRRLRIAYASEDVPAYWGIWINTGVWAGQRHFGVMPTTGRFDQLDRSITDRSAGQVGPLATVRWAVRWTIEPE